MKAIPYIIYGGDTLQDGSQCGMETQRRCEYAIRFFRKHKDISFVIILAAGKRPDKPAYPLLKKIMREYLGRRLAEEQKYHRVHPAIKIILAEENGWGTFNESLAALKAVQKLDVTKVYLHSSWYHIPRVLFIWFIINRFKIRIRPIIVPSPRIKAIVREIGGFCKLPKYWYKWKHS